MFHVKQSGFIALGLTGWLMVGAAVAIGGLGLALKVQTSRLDSERVDHAKTKASFEVFQAGVKALGDAQKAKNDQTLKERERINADRQKALQSRFADLDARYAKLRDSAHPGGGPMPPVPDTARPLDAASRDSRLLEVLRASDLQTATLIELQQWIRDNAKP